MIHIYMYFFYCRHLSCMLIDLFSPVSVGSLVCRQDYTKITEKSPRNFKCIGTEWTQLTFGAVLDKRECFLTFYKAVLCLLFILISQGNN